MPPNRYSSGYTRRARAPPRVRVYNFEWIGPGGRPSAARRTRPPGTAGAATGPAAVTVCIVNLIGCDEG